MLNKSSFGITAITYGLLTLAGIVSFSLPDSLPTVSAAGAPPSRLNLTGIVRDFHKTHPDFNVSPSGSLGHYAGNLATKLTSGVPVFLGGGSLIQPEWRDSAGRNICPTMYNRFAGTTCYIYPGIACDGKVDINNQSIVNSFSSTVGAYGGANITSNALVSTNSIGAGMLSNRNTSVINGSVLCGPGGNWGTVYDTSPNCNLTGTKTALTIPVPMPTIYEPTDLGASTGDLTYNSGTTTLAVNKHVNKLTVASGTTLNISGDLTMLCDSDVSVAGTINVNGTFRLYVKGGVVVGSGSINMNTGNPAKCTIYKIGAGTIDANGNTAFVVARIIAPSADLLIRQSSAVYGTFIGKTCTLDNKAMFHVDSALSGPPNFQPDTAGAKPSSGNGGVSSASSFANWFKDMPGINQAAVYTIHLDRGSDGVYDFTTTDFKPIDNRLYGNEGESRNNYFTYSIDARFTYEACTGQWIEFRGEDDAWIFINNELVMDLGGMSANVTQHVDVDRMGLTPGQTYQLLFLHAQRQTASTRFSMRTNMQLYTVQTASPPISGGYD